MTSVLFLCLIRPTKDQKITMQPVFGEIYPISPPCFLTSPGTKRSAVGWDSQMSLLLPSLLTQEEKIT